MENTNTLIDRINEIRASNGSPPVTLNSKLSCAAELHAAYMLQHNILSHSGRNGSSFDERIRKEDYSIKAAAENIAFGAATEEEVLTLWVNSPPHLENILNPVFTEIGIGEAPVQKQSTGTNNRYWALSLASPSPLPETPGSDPENLLQAEPLPTGPDAIADPF